jgi:hypothetical protein
MTLRGQSLGTSLQLCSLHYSMLSPSLKPHVLTWLISRQISAILFFLRYWVLSPIVQPHDLTCSISRHISATVFLPLLSAVSQCTASWPYPVNLYAQPCNCVSYITVCCLPVYKDMTLTGQSLDTSLHLCILHYWVLSPSVQPHDLTRSNFRHISANVFLTLLSAVSHCTTSCPYPVNL